jgi:hypothetical protein
MSISLKYMPVFRLRQQEKQVLISRSFVDSIYPCIEIIKEFEQAPKTPRILKDKSKKSKPAKTFEQVYLPILGKIDAKRIFVDLPVHMKQPRQLNPEVLSFLRTVVGKRVERTEYMLKLAPLADRIIPVISTYYQKTNEPNSIKTQEKDLRKVFKTLSFRTFPLTFSNDYKQIKEVAKAGDYVIFDIEDALADKADPDVFRPELAELRDKNKCQIVILRNVIPNSIRNSEIAHGKIVSGIVNDVQANYKDLNGTAFGDYAGIKKDDVTSGGGISPGFLFYDATEKRYYGYRADDYVKNGKTIRHLSDFETKIIPAVIKSDAAKRMQSSKLPFLASDNMGWKIINDINKGLEKGKSQAKFKRISMEHYVHCLCTQINNGDFS